MSFTNERIERNVEWVDLCKRLTDKYKKILPTLLCCVNFASQPITPSIEVVAGGMIRRVVDDYFDKRYLMACLSETD